MAISSVVDAVPDHVLAASPFVRQALQRHAEWAAGGGAMRERPAGDMVAELVAALAEQTEESEVMRILRQSREREMARIACRDLAGLASLAQTLGDLSDLADVCCEQALRFSQSLLVQRFGQPRDARGQIVQPVVLGMGKLGGRELNFSSDIDLIFCHGASGETDGPRPIDNAEFFKRLAQSVTRLLSERTEHGFVFRVDLMLRPFGSAGPVSITVDSAEDYYQAHGREWERYALVKARPIAGDLESGYELLRRLRPFVYRRYLDFNAIGSLRALKKLIADDVARRRQADNVKLGIGGIRELEFIVQSFQLVRGGQDASLRDARLRPVLRYLGQSGHLSPETAQRLDDHYVFLRRLENAIQMYADEQTHAMPQDEEAQTALCRGLRYPTFADLQTKLAQVRHEVHEEFRRIFSEPDQQQPEAALSSWVALLWNEVNAEPLLEDGGFAAGRHEVEKSLRDLRDSRSVRSLSPASLERLLVLLPLLLQEAQLQSDAAVAAVRTLGVIQAIGGRSTYLTLLRESAVARTHLVRLCAASPWIAQLLAASPALLDALLDARSLYAPPDRDEIRRDLDLLLTQIPIEETEAGMDALRRYRLETSLRIAAADIAGSLPLVKVSDRLTWLAEAVLQAAFDRAYAELRTSYGEPLKLDGSVAGLAALAYGKFGGIEMGYTSDLDLVFVHDCDALDQETVGGARPIVASLFMARWVQRIIHWLSTLTPAGRAYEVDLELRPSGRSGLAVVSLNGFADYERREAWTWEHQALTRARFAAGSVAIGERFEAIRREVLCRPRDADKLRQEIANMRQKMRAQLEKREPGHWDIKQGEGGLIDIEFITQYLVLRDAAREPALVVWSDNWRQLEALTDAGAVTPSQRDDLIAAYRALRGWSHARGLQQLPVMAPDDVLTTERAAVIAIWQALGLSAA